MSNSTSVLPLSLISYPLSLPLVPYPLVLFLSQKGHPRVTNILPIHRISESESLFSRGSHESLGGSTGADGGQFHHEKVISTVFIFLSGALGGSSEANRGKFHQGSPGTNGGQFYQEKAMSTAFIFL